MRFESMTRDSSVSGKCEGPWLAGSAGRGFRFNLFQASLVAGHLAWQGRGNWGVHGGRSAPRPFPPKMTVQETRGRLEGASLSTPSNRVPAWPRLIPFKHKRAQTGLNLMVKIQDFGSSVSRVRLSLSSSLLLRIIQRRHNGAALHEWNMDFHVGAARGCFS